MRSSFLVAHPLLRRALPWLLWGAAAAVAVPLAWSQAGIGRSPALVQARIATVTPMRTDHRLRVRKVLVQPGQKVKAGEILIEMDTDEIDAEIGVEKAKLAAIEAMTRLQETKLRDDHVRTSHTLASNAERRAIDAARIVAEAEQDRSELAQLEVSIALEEKLVGDKLADAVRLKELEVKRAALMKKVSNYKAAVEQARRSVSGSSKRLGDWRDKEGRLAEIDKDDVPASATAAAVEVQRREIARLELLRSYHLVKAPFDGVIGEVFVREGDLSADPKLPVLTVVQPESTTAVAYLPQTAAESVRVGDRAKLVPRDLSASPVYGKVVALGPSVTQLPIQLWQLPNRPEFGRNVHIQLDKPSHLPGTAMDAVFSRGNGVSK